MSKSCACKFLYGDDTEVTEKENIDKALEEKTELKTEIYLYKKCSKLRVSLNKTFPSFLPSWSGI